MNYRLVFPIAAAIVVTLLPATLIAMIAFSPYTHANLTTYVDTGYSRTQQTTVGAPLLQRSPALAIEVDATAPMEERGKALLAARGCAGCHGLDGLGGVVGPRLIPDIEVLRDNVRKGPGGMPVFAPQEITDYDLTAMAAYLKSVSK